MEEERSKAEGEEKPPVSPAESSADAKPPVAPAAPPPDNGGNDAPASEPPPKTEPTPPVKPVPVLAMADKKPENAVPEKAEGSRAAMPDMEALAKAEKLIRETYKDQLSGTDQAKAARSLWAAISETSVAAERASLLLTAADVAVKAGQFKLAFEIYDDLARKFDFDGLEQKVKTIEEAAKAARLSNERAAVAKAALALLDSAVEKERFELADRAGKAAQAAALRTKDVAFRKEIAAKRADLKKRHAEHEALKKALAEAQRTLAERPDDPAANEALGRHLCFDRNDWRVGLGHLAKSTGALRDAALADMKGTDDAQRQVKLGDLWWELSDADTSVGHEGCRRRAAFWYTQALPRVTGLLKTRTEKRLEEIGDVDLAGQSSGDDRKVTIILAPGVPLVLVKIPASADGKVGEFWLGQTEVTEAQWAAVMKMPPISSKIPKTSISIQDAVSFCGKLSKNGRFSFSIPTDQQFDHAFLAGQTYQFYADNANKFGWIDAGTEVHSVASLKANEFGLHDMLGNVWEWCEGGTIRGGCTGESREEASRGQLVRDRKSGEASPSVGFRVAATLR